MDVELSGWDVVGDGDGLVVDVVAGDDGAGDGGGAVEVDAGGAGGGGIRRIGAVAGDVVADDGVVVHVDGRRRRRG